MLKDRLKSLRASKGLTQKQLAGLVNVTQQAVAKWEKGVSEPDLATIASLADCFDVDVDYLIGKKDSPASSGEHEIGFDDFTYALFHESRDLPEEKKQMLLNMARFMRSELDKEKAT